MLKRGSVVWWNIPDHVTSCLDDLNSYELNHHAPRNDAKAAMIKAVKEAKRKFGWDFDEIKHRMNAQHLKPIDDDEKTVWEIHKPFSSGEETKWSLLAKITLFKLTRKLSINGPESLREYIHTRFKEGSESLDATQVRLITKQVIGGYGTTDCCGFMMRETGGVYFVDERFKPQLENLASYLRSVGGKLHACSIYSDSDTEISTAVASDFSRDLQYEVKKLKEDAKSTMTPNMLQKRIDKIFLLRDRADVHVNNLASNFDKTKKDIDALIKVLESQTHTGKIVEAFDLEAELAEISRQLD